MVYGAEKTKKVDGIEQTVFVANDITMDEINQLEELMADTKRIFIATQKANEKSNEDTKKDNDETNDVLDALCG
jgi:benzoyl-CoA reductase/2-hydroxyglutaryl-CoA dehydratase subunit BcrC/BadD/HgdB